MAQHCFNYRLKTNERYMGEMERTRPIRPADEELVEHSFRAEFHVPIRDWLLIQSDSKRENLYGFLKGAHPRKPLRGAMTLTIPRPQVSRSLELVVRTPNSAIDFNRSVYGPVQSSGDSRAHSRTSIAREGIFGSPDPYTGRAMTAGGCTRLSESLVKKLFKPVVAVSLNPLSEEYYALLQELILWTEKKTMRYPQRESSEIRSLRDEGRLSKGRLEEDHMYAPGHRGVTGTKLARDLTVRSLTAELAKASASRYQDCFCDELHASWLTGGPPQTVPAIRQVGNPRPFALFPEVRERPRTVLLGTDLLRLSVENRAQGQANKSVYAGRTCL
jgi:hypothetical protein